MLVLEGQIKMEEISNSRMMVIHSKKKVVERT